jgi:6-pyruvoyl-tetrahydropterin synthase
MCVDTCYIHNIYITGMFVKRGFVKMPKKIKKSYSKNFDDKLLINVNSEFKEKLEFQANLIGIDLSSLVRMWLSERLNKENQKDKDQ